MQDICLFRILLFLQRACLSASIYPSPEQDPTVHSIPISNNTGSLPDLTNLQFPSPMATPLDADDQYSATQVSSPGNLSPTLAAHNMAAVSAQQSPVARRRHAHGGPSPLVLQGGPAQLQHAMVSSHVVVA